LADYARGHNPNVAVVPTTFDLNHYTRRPAATGADPLIVGWVGGPSTSHYLLAISDVFRRLADRYGDRVRFVVQGDPEFRPVVPQMQVRPWRLATEVQDLQ